MTQVATITANAEDVAAQKTVQPQAQLLQDGVAPENGGMYNVPLSRISRTPAFKNPRKHRNKEAYAEHRQSIKEQGVLQPIVLRIVEANDAGEDLEVVAGETRFLASAELGLPNIPATVRVLDLREATVIAGIENMERSDMSEVEEGELAAQLLTSFNNDRKEVMKRLDWSETKLNSRLAITKVTPFVQDALVQKTLFLGHVERLAGIPKHRQDDVAKKIIENGYTVTETIERLAKRTRPLKAACFDLSDCIGCQFNSSTTADLFASQQDMEKEFCANDGCWEEKTKARLDIIVSDAKEDCGTVFLSNEIADTGYTALEESGENGVGKAQKASCVSCEHYGAVVSTVFGTEGQERRGLCFNLECNAEKVSAYRTLVAKASAKPEQSAPTTTGQKPGKGAGKAPAGKPSKEGAGSAPKEEDADTAVTLTPDNLRKGVKQEAINRFRTMGADGVKAHPRIGMTIALLTLLKDIDTHSFPDAVRQDAKTLFNTLLEEAKQLPAINDQEKGNAATSLAVLPETRLIEAMTHLGSLTVWRDLESALYEKHNATKNAAVYAKVNRLDAREYVCMSPAYRKAQVKAMLVQDCLKSGFADAYDDVKGKGEFAKLAKGKAVDIHNAIDTLAFEWKGYEPTGFSYEFYNL